MTARMAATADKVSTKLVDAEAKAAELVGGVKRQLAARMLEPGASVSIAARRHDIRQPLFARRISFETA